MRTIRRPGRRTLRASPRSPSPVRRALYLFVSRQADAVSREQAAAAVDVPAHTAKFHLERLVDRGSARRGVPQAHRAQRARSRATRRSSTAARRERSRCRCRSGTTTCSAGSWPRRSSRPSGTKVEVGDAAADGGSPRGPGRRPERLTPRRRADPNGRHARAARLRATRRGQAGCCWRTAPSTGSPRTTPSWSAGSTWSTSRASSRVSPATSSPPRWSRTRPVAASWPGCPDTERWDNHGLLLQNGGLPTAARGVDPRAVG